MTQPHGLLFGQGFTEEEIQDLGLGQLKLGTCSRDGLMPKASASSTIDPKRTEGRDAGALQTTVQSTGGADKGRVASPVTSAPMSWAARIKKQDAHPTQPAAVAMSSRQRSGAHGEEPLEAVPSTATQPAAQESGNALTTAGTTATATLDSTAPATANGSLETEEDEVVSISENVRHIGALPVPTAGEAGRSCTDPASMALAWLTSATQSYDSGAMKAQMVYLQPRGLVNNGSTCYMNATLQALVACPPFALFLHKLSQALPELVASETPTLHALGQLARELGPAKSLSVGTATGPALGGGILNPRSMDPVMRAFSPSDASPAAPGEPDQHDAQEFLTFTLDAAHQELLSLESKDSSHVSGATPGGQDDGEWEQVGRGNKSAVTRGQVSAQGGTSYLSSVFGGALWSEVRTPGARPSATKQHFTVLPLDIYPESVDSVEAALHLHTSPETITGYRAEGSRQAVDATKRVQLLELPQILVLHLMRFTFGASGTGKMHKTVSYRPVLKLKPTMLADGCSTSRSRALYDLLAVVQHHGRTPTVGHYTADVRCGGRTGPWLHLNDSSVTTANEQDVLHGQAYLLFYIRRDD